VTGRSRSGPGLKSIALGTGLGAVLSVVLAVILLVATGVNGQIAFLTALDGTILSSLLGVGLAFGQRLDDIERKILDGSKLRALAGLPAAETHVVDLAKGLAVVASAEGGQRGLFWQASMQALEDAAESVRSVAEGVVCCSSQDEIFYVEKALIETTRCVDAVAARGLEWWTRPEADVYWSAYVRAAKRLVIRRIFVVDEPPSETLANVLDRHVSAGMHAYWILKARVPQRLHRPIVLFDDKLVHRSTSSSKLGSEGVDFTRVPRDIAEARGQFDAILALPATEKWAPRTPVPG
jgi:hypothetical protein